MALKRRKYPSKLLLFGEYGVLLGLDALAIPYPEFTGKLEVSGDVEEETFRKILERLKLAKSSLPFKIDIERFEKDITNGLMFNSQIPLNYGLGSSGALVASIFENYFEPKNKRQKTDLRALKTTLALLESPFHGISSGIDPLVSLINKPILVRKSGRVMYLNKPVLPHRRRLQFFLIDSNYPGKTGDMVTQFMERMTEIEFSETFRNAYQKYSNGSISSLLNGNFDRFTQRFKDLSEFQLDEMGLLIPENIKEIFRLGLHTGDFYVKICGSGGGGFFLGITKKKKQLRELLNEPILFL